MTMYSQTKVHCTAEARVLRVRVRKRVRVHVRVRVLTVSPRECSCGAASYSSMPPSTCSQTRRTAIRYGHHERSDASERSDHGESYGAGFIPGAQRTSATALSTYLSDFAGILDREQLLLLRRPPCESGLETGTES